MIRLHTPEELKDYLYHRWSTKYTKIMRETSYSVSHINVLSYALMNRNHRKFRRAFYKIGDPRRISLRRILS